MYPVLILRAEIVSLVILIFLAMTAVKFNMGKDSKTFTALLAFAITHVIFDIITVITVNNAQVPSFINKGAHIIFYFSAIMYAKEMFQYVINKYYDSNKKKVFYYSFIPLIIYAAALPFLKLQFDEYEGTWSSGGPAAMVGYGIAFVFFIIAYILTLVNYKKQTHDFSMAMIVMMSILIVAEFVQAIYKPFLFTGCAITIVTVGFFFTLENPVYTFEKKLMTDALTGMGSRHNYEQRMKELEKEWSISKENKYLIAFCDINHLKSVNNTYGHLEGDHYISIVATSMAASLVNADAIYRTGGDEFVVVYKNKDEDFVVEELDKVNKCLEAYDDKLPYCPGLAIGYAVSSNETKHITDLIQTADYAMYRSKAETHLGSLARSSVKNTRINPIGLDRSLFAPLCKLSNHNYPLITNLDTNVTRISPELVSRFKLPDEFISDFHEYWSKLIHPDDRVSLEQEFAKVLSNKDLMLNINYRVLDPDNKYVEINMIGQIVSGDGVKSDIFFGIIRDITNHTKEAKVK